MSAEPFLSRSRAYQVSVAVLALCAAMGVALATVAIPPVVPALAVFLAVECAIWSVTARRAGGQRDRRLDAAGGFGASAKTRSIYDQETGLCAEWYFLLRLDEEIARSERNGQPLGLLFMEPRRELGQRARNTLLDCMGSAFRSADLVGHFGGLRFAALLLEADRDGARTVGDRVTFETGGGSVSVQVAVYPHDGQDWRTLLAAAGLTWSAAFPVSEPIWTSNRRSRFERKLADRRKSA